MAALRAAKQALRKEIKKRVAAMADEEKVRQSGVVSQKVKNTGESCFSTCASAHAWLHVQLVIHIKLCSCSCQIFDYALSPFSFTHCCDV